MVMTAADTNRAILAVWRIEQPRLITSLAQMLRDVPLAEDLTQETLLAALEHWPVTGVPDKPGAWLMATAKNRAFDHLRRGRMLRASTNSSPPAWRPAWWRSSGPRPTSMLRSTTISAMRCSASSLLLVTRYCRARRGLPWRCGWSAV
jgi:DNA-directed RNA polymerase specialized sigma24 family protein